MEYINIIFYTYTTTLLLTVTVRTYNTGHGRSHVPHLAFILYILSQFIKLTKKKIFRFYLFAQLEQPRELETNY